MKTPPPRHILLALVIACAASITAAARAQGSQASRDSQAATTNRRAAAIVARPSDTAQGETQAAVRGPEKKDYVMPHVMNGRELAVPAFAHGLEREIELPRWAPVHVGPLTLDLSPTKHVVMLWIAAALCLAVLITAGRGAIRARMEGRPASGLAGAIEAMVLYLRNDVILPNIGHNGDKYVPYCLSVFFMILFCNLLGLFPYMATPTGNLSVTATLAIISFIMIEIAGMRSLGKAYINTIVYWPHDLPVAIKAPITVIMTPVEILSKLTKPFALAMRLFANMTAGHIAILALIGIVFVVAQLLSSPVLGFAAAAIPVGLSTAIMGLEVFVAFLQAFIFMLLTAVFIGQIREAHH